MIEPVEHSNDVLAAKLKAVEALTPDAQLPAFEEILSKLGAELDQKAED